MAADVQRFADRPKVTVVGVNEVADANVAELCPKGWRRWRPQKERSSAVYWDPKEEELLGKGAFQLHSKGWRAPRYVVWVRLRNRKTGKVRRFGVVHLVAFKTSNAKNGVEYEYQVRRLAIWLARPGHRISMGDMNGEAGSRWLEPVDEVARPMTPPVKSGPDGQPIDIFYVAKGHPRARNAKALPGGSDHHGVEAEIPDAA